VWADEHSVETTGAPEQIWRLLSSVAAWPKWKGDIERIEPIGPFAAGSRMLMTRSERSRRNLASQRPSAGSF
jgi:hypothetical protein